MSEPAGPRTGDEHPTVGAGLPVDHDAHTVDTGAGAVGAIGAGGRDLSAGDQVGVYRLIEVLGEGGFGLVYRAEQREPVQRQVALKVIKLGMDTRQVVARFEAERRALAMMEHPGIARVFDAGVTERGRPYFVMELVRGVPITQYADKQNLPTRERLRLFVSVCRAVQHAHQKGIIHRDIKPSNVLVTLVDGQPVAKVIDFGIAKAVHGPLTEHTVFTQQKQMIGTPEYMSPEQAEASGLDIDTRADIYSLGVLLYELLTGVTPFETARMERVSQAEFTRLLRETEAPRPSVRVGTLGEAAQTVASHQRVSAVQLRRDLRGDLDWIVLKAIEKDRTRRYESCDALAEDIRRHLEDEPVSAGPPTVGYRVQKFVRRNRALVAAGGAVAAALVAGAGLATAGFVRASEQRDAARASEIAAIEARDEARAARDESDAVTGFLAEMLAAADPSGLGRDVRVRDVLDRASGELTGRFGASPGVEGRLAETIGRTYLSLGLYDDAESQLLRAETLAAKTGGRDGEATLRAEAAVGELRHRQGRYADAAGILEAVAPKLDGVDAEAGAAARRTLAQVYESQSRFEEAAAVYERALAALRGTGGADDPEVLRTQTELAHLRTRQGLLGEAEALHRSTLAALERTLGAEHPDTLSSRSELAWVVFQAGRQEEAVSLARPAVEASERVLGEDHPQTLERLSRLAQMLTASGKPGEAVPLLESVTERRRRSLGAEHPETLSSQGALALAIGATGKRAEAETLFRRTLETQKRVLGAGHEGTVATAANLVNLLVEMNRVAEAWALLEETLRVQTAERGGQHPTTIALRITRAGLLQRRGSAAEAMGAYEEVIRDAEVAIGEDHPFTLAARANLALLYRQAGRSAEAEAMYAAALAGQRRTLAPDNPNLLRTALNLGELQRLDGRLDEAWGTLSGVLERLAALGDRAPQALAQAAGANGERLATAYLAQGAAERALTVLDVALPVMRRTQPAGEAALVRAEIGRAVALVEAGRRTEAEEESWAFLEATLRAAESEDADPLVMAAAAQALLVCPVEELRDPRRAFELASRANRATNLFNSAVLDTLAEAQWQLGDREEAITTLRRAVRISALGSVQREVVVARLEALLASSGLSGDQ